MYRGESFYVAGHVNRPDESLFLSKCWMLRSGHTSLKSRRCHWSAVHNNKGSKTTPCMFIAAAFMLSIHNFDILAIHFALLLPPSSCCFTPLASSLPKAVSVEALNRCSREWYEHKFLLKLLLPSPHYIYVMYSPVCHCDNIHVGRESPRRYQTAFSCVTLSLCYVCSQSRLVRAQQYSLIDKDSMCGLIASFTPS